MYVLGPFSAVFLLAKPYSETPLTRYHALQATIAMPAYLLASVALRLAANSCPPAFQRVLLPAIAFFHIIWIVWYFRALFRAFSGHRAGLPLLGLFAERFAGHLEPEWTD